MFHYVGNFSSESLDYLRYIFKGNHVLAGATSRSNCDYPFLQITFSTSRETENELTEDLTFVRVRGVLPKNLIDDEGSHL